MFKIDNEKEFISFLKILAEESVKKSKKVLLEGDDPFNSYYKEKRKKEDAELFEQEAASELPKEEPLDTDELPDKEPSDGLSEPAANEELFVASKDRLVDFVNDIRSAPSIKDSAVSSEIDSYYDRLSQEEKDVLVFFLRELSRVMTGKASGSEARDPSDPPLNISFVQKGEEESAKEEAPSEEEEETNISEPPPKASSGEGEDTSAPIKVNESQDHRALRLKIQSLLG